MPAAKGGKKSSRIHKQQKHRGVPADKAMAPLKIKKPKGT